MRTPVMITRVMSKCRSLCVPARAGQLVLTTCRECASMHLDSAGSLTVRSGWRTRPLAQGGRLGKQDEVRERVMELIESLDFGQAIPSERRLCEQLGVSRLTLRAALDDLVREGHLTRRHGSGTYVSRPKIAQPLTLTSFSEDMRRRGMVPGSRTLELATTLAGARLA